jgi:hypothetical protein
MKISVATIKAMGKCRKNTQKIRIWG